MYICPKCEETVQHGETCPCQLLSNGIELHDEIFALVLTRGNENNLTVYQVVGALEAVKFSLLASVVK